MSGFGLSSNTKDREPARRQLIAAGAFLDAIIDPANKPMQRRCILQHRKPNKLESSSYDFT
jgi:hypothetical protein